MRGILKTKVKTSQDLFKTEKCCQAACQVEGKRQVSVTKVRDGVIQKQYAQQSGWRMCVQEYLKCIIMNKTFDFFFSLFLLLMQDNKGEGREAFYVSTVCIQPLRDV